MTTFKIKELGCKVNQYESQLMREQLEAIGFVESHNGEPADIYLINTCTVTQAADSDSRSFIRNAIRSNPSAKIIVTGCYVEKDADEIKRIYKDAIIVKNDEKENVLSVILSPEGAKNLGGQREILRRPAEGGTPQNDMVSGISGFADHNRAFVKIQDGCDNHCSYCKVPLVRGASRNRDMGLIIKEATQLVNNGFKEIVLCGICLGAYKDLIALLGKLEKIKDLYRIRLSSIEPRYINNKLIDSVSSSGKICKHLHIPLQSGDDKILKAMNRKYTSGQYIKIIEKIRKKMPNVAIATDIMVGFPGETNKEFKNTIEVVKAVKPMRSHIFTFSKREGTQAFYMDGEVDKAEKSRRLHILKKVTDEISFSYKKRFQGHTVEVLVENNRDKKTNLLTGYTDTYIKVLFEGEYSIINELRQLKITKVFQPHAYVWGILRA
jgi:threonylcarbamoyladenosine tRNA methylthiotransferase MtaB